MTVTVSSAELRSLIRDCFERLDVPEADAEAVADALTDANLRGNDSHGFARTPAYMRRVAAGFTGGTARMREVAAWGPLRRLDAGSALGPAAAVKATDLAIELAHDHGIGLVAIGNSSHLGAAGFYARRAATAGLMAVVATNGPANMAPYGSSERFLGTDAFSVAVPAGSRAPVVLDMSCSAVARGKIMRAKELGEPIEPGVAIDPDGQPATDPAAALAGAVLPVGGPKGTGLALAISIMVGVLAGAGFDDEVVPMHGDTPRAQNLGHLFLVADPWRLADRDEADARVDALIDRLHALRPAAGFDRVLFPGERGDMQARTGAESGVPIDSTELQALANVCQELGLRDLGARAMALVRREGK